MMEEVEEKEEVAVTPAVADTDSAVDKGGVEDYDGCTTEPTSVPCRSGDLPWEQDLQMVSLFMDKKEELKGSYKQYMQNSPELRAMMADFMQAVLIQKPGDVYGFARDYFSSFAKDSVPQPSYPSHSI